MASIGLNVSADGRHSPDLIRSLGATWIRIVAKPEYDLRDYFQQCRDAGIQILLVFARESGGDYARYRDLYASLVAAVQVGNEADLVSPSSWTMTQVELAALGRSVRAIFPDTPIVCAGMASGHPEWMDGMDLSPFDTIGVHGYLKDAPNPNDLEDLPDIDVLMRGYQRFGKTILATEYGWWDDREPRASEETRDIVGWAAKTDLCEVFFWFCLDDAMVPPFGLLDARGREKPRARVFKEQAATAIHSLWPNVTAGPEPKTRDEVIAISNATADEVGIPRLLLLACGVAESDLVWNARRPKTPAQDAAYWTDVSHGVWQQTVRWSQEYKDWYTNDAPGHNPSTFPGADVTEAAGVHYYDVEHAAKVAARQLKAHYRWMLEGDAIFKALCRYNWPAGNGAPKTPEHEANYRRGIREAEAILGVSEPVPPPPGNLGPWPTVSYESHPIPAAGAFAGAPRGIVLHGSRSGAAGNSQDQEYRGTVNWAKNNPAGLGWNVTIADHRVAEHIDVEHWGHHAKSASRYYLSIEFAQPTVDRDITDAQADAAAHWIKTRVWPVWGELWHFPTHSEVQASGETSDSGNTDVYPLADPRLDVLRNRIYERLRQPLDVEPAPEPPPPPPPPSRAAVLVAEIETRLQELKELVA